MFDAPHPATSRPTPPTNAQTQYRKQWRRLLHNPEDSAKFDQAWDDVIALEDDYQFSAQLLRSLRS